MTICVSNLNQGIGEWQANTERMKRAIRKAKTYPDPVLLFPELATVGCDAGDLLLRHDTYVRSQEVLQAVLAETTGITVVCGALLYYQGRLYNAAAVMRDGRILAWIPKRYADPTTREDARWFSAWEFIRHVDIDGIPVGAWTNGSFDVVVGNLSQQPDPIRGTVRLWLNAMPFAAGTYTQRLDKLLAYTMNYQITLACANMLGSPDGTTVYDGGGIILKNGTILSESPRFLISNDLTLISEKDERPPISYPSLVAYHDTGSFPKTATDLYHVEVELALVSALHDYFKRAHIGHACLALSGGRDSAMVAVLIHRLVTLESRGKSPEEIREIMKNFLICAYLPSEHSSDATRQAALSLAEHIGATCHVIPIDEILQQTLHLVETQTNRPLCWSSDDLTLQNLQARTRSSVIWTLANANNALLLTTGNMSEAAVGYTTMDGDTSGGLAPIANLPKTYVSQWLEWARHFHGLSCLDLIFARPPSAELRPSESNQQDEADLMPYPVLDNFIDSYIVRRLDAAQTLQNAMPLVSTYYQGNTEKLRQDLEKFIRMSALSQWKRNRFANAFKVMPFDLDPRSGLRWPTLQHLP